MAYGVELAKSVDRELDKLDPQQRKRILKFLHEQVARLDDPRSVGEALHGSQLGEFWKYRVGDYRLICKIQDVSTSDFQPLGARNSGIYGSDLWADSAISAV